MKPEPLNRSFGKFLRTCSDKSFQRCFSCDAAEDSPEFRQASREYHRRTLLLAWSQLFYSLKDEIDDES